MENCGPAKQVQHAVPKLGSEEEPLVATPGSVCRCRGRRLCMRARRAVLTALSVLCLLLLAPTIGILVDLTANVGSRACGCWEALAGPAPGVHSGWEWQATSF